MRRNIALHYDNAQTIYLYTHWDAVGLETTLASSLERARERWNDPTYLARIIFTDMTDKVGQDLTGYGLSPFEIDPEYSTLNVDLEQQSVNGIAYEQFIVDASLFPAAHDADRL